MPTKAQKQKIDKTLCIGSKGEEHAKLYAICIFYLIRDKLNDIKNTLKKFLEYVNW